MTTREHPPAGSPCWTDLWTSDVETSRRFYAELLRWEPLPPSPEHGGYFMWARDGAPVAGGMGPMGDQRPDDRWKVYLATDDATKTVEAASAAGAQVHLAPVPVDDLGTQAVLADPTGAVVGLWQPGTFPGFTVLNEHGAPSWFELQTRDHAGALDFYRAAFAWDVQVEGDTDEFRYATMRDPEGDGVLAGVVDASAFLPAGDPPLWMVYWEVDDAAAAVARAAELGATVLMGAQDTPYGQLAQLVDPVGARFSLRTSPR